MDALSCSIHALLACFSWSSFYVDGGLSYQDSEMPRLEWVTRTNHGGNAIETVTTLMPVDEPFNPYGRIALGYELQFKSLSLALEVSHVSSLDTDQDHGINAISVRARWYPFRR